MEAPYANANAIHCEVSNCNCSRTKPNVSLTGKMTKADRNHELNILNSWFNINIPNSYSISHDDYIMPSDLNKVQATPALSEGIPNMTSIKGSNSHSTSCSSSGNATPDADTILNATARDIDATLTRSVTAISCSQQSTVSEAFSAASSATCTSATDTYDEEKTTYQDASDTTKPHATNINLLQPERKLSSKSFPEMLNTQTISNDPHTHSDVIHFQPPPSFTFSAANASHHDEPTLPNSSSPPLKKTRLQEKDEEFGRRKVDSGISDYSLDKSTSSWITQSPSYVSSTATYSSSSSISLYNSESTIREHNDDNVGGSFINQQETPFKRFRSQSVLVAPSKPGTMPSQLRKQKMAMHKLKQKKVKEKKSQTSPFLSFLFPRHMSGPCHSSQVSLNS
jgi:hypothetical protein